MISGSRWGQVAEWMKQPPSIGAEIGVKEGRFISFMLNRFPDLVMYAIDPWENQPGNNETYEGWDWSDIYKRYKTAIRPYADRVLEIQDYSENASKQIYDESLDFVFIDAQHDYDSVKRDIELWTPKLKPGGLLSGHDYQPNFQGVIQAVDEAVGRPIIGGNDTWAAWV